LTGLPDPGDVEQPAVELHVLACMLADLGDAEGRRPLGHYLARFAGHEAIVRRCHAGLRRRGGSPPPTTA
jgi:hypothetical protein